MTTLSPRTAEEIINAEGTRMRRDRWRWDLINLQGDKIGELHPSRTRPPTIRSDTGGRLGRTLTSFHLPAADRTEIDYVAHGVRPYLITEDGTEWPLGVYRWADPATDVHSYGTNREASLVDRMTILDQQVTKAYSWKAGTQITPVLAKVLGEVLPATQYQITASPEVLYGPLAFPIGTPRLNIVADLLEKLAYLPAHFDHQGVFIGRPVPDPNLASPQVTYRTGSRVEAGSVGGTNTLLDTPNEYMVFSADGQGPGFIGRYRVPDSAPHSRTRRGYPVPMTRSVSGLASYTQATLMAIAMAVTDGKAYEFRSFRAPADPRHDSWTVIDFYGSRWIETAWDLVCAPTGLHSHVIRQVYTDSWVAPT